MKRTLQIYVIDQTPSGKAIKCAMQETGEDSFFLPKSQIQPHGSVRKNQFNAFDVPEWLALQHWQICGREAFEEEKRRRAEYESKMV